MEEGTTRLDPMDELDILSGPYLEPYWDDFVKFEYEVRHVRSWSWGAFLFGVLWFMPRRLYGWTAASLVILAAFILIAESLHQPWLLLALYGCWMVVRGSRGKYMFYRSLKSRARKAGVNSDSEEEYISKLRRLAITGNSAYTAISVIIALVVAMLFAAVAIPNMLHYCAKSKKSEARTNLKGIFTAQVAYFEKNGRFGAKFDDIGFELAGNHAKIYTFGMGSQRIGVPDAVNKARLDELTAGFDNRTGFVAYAVGNIDADPALDVWAIYSDNNLVNLVDDIKE